MASQLAARVEELRANRTHGGSWMARHAVEALLEVAAEPADSTEELLDRLRAAGGALADARPAMGAIAGAVGRVLASAQMAARHMTPDELRRLVTEEGTSLVAGRDRAAASIAVHLAPMLRDALVLTHSASATVREGVVHTPPEVVVCTVSAPFEEGRRMVEELKEAGLRVELVDDDAALTALERSSLLLLGADTVFEDGAVANKIGTRRLAEEATRLGVRTVVACEVLKIAPVAAPTAPDEPESRDVTGSEHVDVVVTEEGPIAGDDLRSLIDRTPFLRDGYRLLRGSG